MNHNVMSHGVQILLPPLDSWEAGHNIAESKGGKTNVKNLRPICSQCNKSMGTRSITEFSDTHDGYAIDYTSAKYTVRHPREVDTANSLLLLLHDYATDHQNKTCTCLSFINRQRCGHLYPRQAKNIYETDFVNKTCTCKGFYYRKKCSHLENRKRKR